MYNNGCVLFQYTHTNIGALLHDFKEFDRHNNSSQSALYGNDSFKDGIVNFLNVTSIMRESFMSGYLQFSAHMNRRLTRWAYSIAMIRRPSVVVHNFKHLPSLLANESQILCGTSMGRGNERLFAACRSHDQDGRHAHKWSNPFNNLLRNMWVNFHVT